MRHRIVFSSDIHGNATQYSKLVDYVAANGAHTLIIGGDLAPKGLPRDEYISTQREFLRGKFRTFFKGLKLTGVDIFLIMGNDDCGINKDVLDEVDPDLFRVIHGVRASINDEYEIVGYPFVPISPVGIKDWEKFDMSEDDLTRQTSQRLYGHLSARGVKHWWQRQSRLKEFEFVNTVLSPADAHTNSIQNDLSRPVFTRNPSKTVYVMHAPPFGTNLDKTGINPSYSVGSVAVRQFIESHKPHVTLHGHIHETVDVSGDFREKIGDSVALASGNHPRGERLALVAFDLADPLSAERIVL